MMNDLEALQRASERQKFLAPFKPPQPKTTLRAERRSPYIRIGIMLIGLVIIGTAGVKLYKEIQPVIPKAKVIVYGAPNGAAFVVANRDDRPVRLVSFVVNGHYKLNQTFVIPPGNRCDIPCFALEDDAGRKFVPDTFTQGYHGISIVCAAAGRIDYKYIGKPSPLPPPPAPREYSAADDPLLDYLRD